MTKKESKVQAILTSDWHIWNKPPVWRSCEPDWMAAMGRPIESIIGLSKTHQCPIFIAGDIFHRWNASPDTINWLIDRLRAAHQAYAIPGQHDMPNHNLSEMQKSAYETLVKSGVLISITKPIELEHCILHGKAFGCALKPASRTIDKKMTVLLTHEYLWTDACGFPDAPKENHIKNLSKEHKTYDIIVAGDNHKGFRQRIGSSTIFNCGSPIRRTKDELTHKPQVGLLCRDGSIVVLHLDTTKDKYLESEDSPTKTESEFNIELIANELRKLGTTALDFTTAVTQYCQKNKEISNQVVKIIQKAMEPKHDE